MMINKFELIKPSFPNFKIISQHYLLKSSIKFDFIVSDGNTLTPAYFKCKNCNNSFNIDHKNALNYEKYRLGIPTSQMKQFGGGGYLFKVYKCNKCLSFYYFGFGYKEINYGRDTFFIHTILELKEINNQRDDFYGNMGEPETIEQYKAKYGSYPPNYDKNGNRIND